MPFQSTAARADRLVKRNQLKTLVAQMGESASPPQIREEAYRTGIGQINTAMLIAVRNELWPNRKRRSKGRPKGSKATKVIYDGKSLVSEFKCVACGSLNTRYKHNRVSTSLYRCLDCQHVFELHKFTGKKVRAERLMAMVATEKECSKCNRTLPVDCFAKKSTGDILLKTTCKECSNRTRAESGFRKKLAEFGLTYESYLQVYESQSGLCDICKKPGGGKGNRWVPLCIDHCHKTGKFRSLLCDKCNLGIGNFDDNPELLAASAEYLRRHGEEVHHGS